MGLPMSLALGALYFAMPDATLISSRGYDVYNGTWKWGYHPEGEIAVALQQGVQYLVMTPEQFERDFPVILPPPPPAPTTTSTISLPATTTLDDNIPTPEGEFQEFLEIEAYNKVIEDLGIDVQPIPTPRYVPRRGLFIEA